MKPNRKSFLVAALMISAVAWWVTPAAADSYLTLNAGAYVPQGDADDLDPGPTVNLVYGFDILPMVWGEVGAGFARAEKDDIELEVIPVTLSGKFRLPIPLVKPYILAGGGAYLATLDVPGGGSDRDTVFGYQAAAGVDLKILVAKVNLEVEYFWAEPELHGATVDLEGVLATVGVGIEF